MSKPNPSTNNDPSLGLAFMRGITNDATGVNPKKQEVEQNSVQNHFEPSNPTQEKPIPVQPINVNQEGNYSPKQSSSNPLDEEIIDHTVPKDRTEVNRKPVQQQQPEQGAKKVAAATNIQTLSNGKEAKTYDPFDDLKKGKTEEEVVAKLKTENSRLRKELRSISSDLTVLLEKKKNSKTTKSVKLVKDIVANVGISEEGLRSELDVAQKQLVRYQKETSQMRSKYQNQASYEKYVELQEGLYQKQARIEQLQSQKKVIEKTLRDHERTLSTLLAESDNNIQVSSLTEETRLYREKIKDTERKIETMDRHAQNRQVFKKSLIEELTNLQQEVQRVQQITKFEGFKETKIEQPKTEKVLITPKTAFVKKGKKPEALEFNAENYEKLKKEWKILQKSGQQKNKQIEQELENLREMFASTERAKEDANQRFAEKEKEIALLNTKLKDLKRIVRHQAVVPLQKESEADARELPHMKSAELKSSLIKKDAYLASKARNESKLSKDAGKNQSSLLVEYAKHHFQSKGFRKDEKGKVVKEDEGVNFSDKDLVGKQQVRIIAVDVWYDEQKITGIQAVYESESGEVIEGEPHVVNPEKSKMITFETLEEDYLKEISGFMNKSETVIECLIMRTFRGETTKIGQPSKDSKLFKFDINELEYPAVLYGSIKEKEDEHGNGRLARLGVLISSETVEERLEGKFNKRRTSANGLKGEENQEKDVTDRVYENDEDEEKEKKSEKSERQHEKKENSSGERSEKEISERIEKSERNERQSREEQQLSNNEVQEEEEMTG